jgi:hypothetical protein
MRAVALFWCFHKTFRTDALNSPTVLIISSNKITSFASNLSQDVIPSFPAVTDSRPLTTSKIFCFCSAHKTHACFSGK